MRIYHNLFLFILLPACLIACKNEPKGQAAIAGNETNPPLDMVQTQNAADSSVPTIASVKPDDYVDSMMSLEVTLPPILDEKAYDTATVNSFTKMADLTKGEMKLLASADLLEKNITSILCKNTTDFADVLFLVDNTGSMEDDIANVKEGMNQILDALREKKGIRLAIATYRDKQYDSTNWFSFREFETDYKAAKAFTDSMKLIPNNDLPESVYEAFIAAADHKFWRSRTKRVVLIIGDARGKTKEEGAQYTIDDMLRKAGESKIKVNFFPLIVTPYSEKYREHDMNPQPATETHLLTSVWPNPTSDVIHIKMERSGRYRLAVYTMTGVLVEDHYIDSDEWRIDMRIHYDGLYVVRVTDRNNQYDMANSFSGADFLPLRH